ncbi:hypothetical protein B3286c1_1405 [Brucella vulpis]|nr:hypothetical protein BF3285c1_1406 [Brucella vulpis]CUW50217.1 hypothetical protein B3286c1_1405 [Brucella vulpis]
MVLFVKFFNHDLAATPSTFAIFQSIIQPEWNENNHVYA